MRGLELAVASRVARALLPQVRADGRRRRGVHRRAAQAVAVGAAPHHAARRGGGDLDARSDPRRAVRADLPGLHVPGARGLPPRHPGCRHRRRPACWPRTARSAASASTSWCRARTPAQPWTMHALEINLRVLGTTHPVPRAAVPHRRPARSRHRPVPLAERPRQVLHGDRQPARHRAYRGVLPEDLIDIVTNNGLHYSYRTESGVLFHLIGALSEWGKLGVTVIANSQRRGQRALSPHARGARSRSRPRPRAQPPQGDTHEDRLDGRARAQLSARRSSNASTRSAGRTASPPSSSSWPARSSTSRRPTG